MTLNHNPKMTLNALLVAWSRYRRYWGKTRKSSVMTVGLQAEIRTGSAPDVGHSYSECAASICSLRPLLTGYSWQTHSW